MCVFDLLVWTTLTQEQKTKKKCFCHYIIIRNLFINWSAQLKIPFSMILFKSAEYSCDMIILSVHEYYTANRQLKKIVPYLVIKKYNVSHHIRTHSKILSSAMNLVWNRLPTTLESRKLFLSLVTLTHWLAGAIQIANSARP